MVGSALAGTVISQAPSADVSLPPDGPIDCEVLAPLVRDAEVQCKSATVRAMHETTVTEERTIDGF
jgi:hypothetical protein